MSSLRRNPVGNARFFTTSRMSHKNVSKFCRSPGGILFSSVSGGFPDVHSSDGYSANVPAKCAQREDERNIHPVSLFNSLLDPNIELPTISVREVDEILSNLTSENSSPSKPTNGLSSNSTTHINFCDIPDNLCHDSVRYIKSEAISKPHPFSGKNCSLQSITVSLVNETEGIGHNVANDSSMCINSPQVDRLPVSSNVCHTLVLDSPVSSEARNSFDDLSTLDSPPVQNSCHISSSRHQTIDVKKHGNEIPHKKNNPKTVSLQSMADILPLFPSCRSVAELGVLALGSESSGTAAHKHKFPNATLRSKACSGTNLCNISTKASISNVLRDRSPIGSLDLATHARYQNSFNASNIHEASRYRQAYLSVRKANQAKILSKSTANTVEFSVFNANSQGNTGNEHVSYQPLKSPQPTAGMKITSTNRLGCSTGTTDDRFKHICPHPRCGRRYQAEIGLLRHLVKYHGEQIELPQRTRSVANQQMLRRPASEERTITSIGFNDIDEMDKISPKQSLSKNRTVSLSHSKSFLESNQIEMTKIDFNPSTLPFETIQINEYTSSDELSCDKIKEVTPILDKGLSFVCSATSNEDGTSVSVPLIDLNTDICSNNFPISVDMDSTNSNDVTIHSLTDETKLPVFMKQPFRKQPRLRSVSGGSHNDLPIIKNTINSINPSDITIQCKHQLSALSNLSTSYITTVNKQKVCKIDNCRRRTLSTGHDPRQVLNMNSDNIDNSHHDNNNNNDNLSNKCPSCGHIVDWNLCKTKQREWISGVHALSCSKTDCVYCPVDNCTYLCSGRADLSAHLTSIHFPEIQHQLVRLIFACPLKDCQIICSDEASFQAHFTGHLHGHLPGDLTELFNPSSLTTTIGTKILSPTAMTTVTSTPVVVTSTPIVQSLIDNCVDTSSHSLSSNLSYGQTTHCLTDYTTTTLSQSSACDNYHVSLINIQPNLVVGGNNLSGTYEKSPDSDNIHSEATLVTAVAATPTAVDLIPSNHTSSFDNSTESMLINHQQSASIVSVPSDLNGFSHYCPHQHHHQRQQQPQQHFSVFPSSPLFPNHEGSITTLSEALKSDTDDNVNDVSNNFTNVGTTETDHVDLTDNRNLLSALDLIPDDILIELLKEDRASLWGDPVTSNNNNNRSNRATNSVLSAPYECNTESPCSIVDNTNNNNNINDNYIPIKCVENNEEDYSVNYNPCDTSSIHDSIDDWIDFNVTDSVSRLNSLENLHKRNISSSNLSDDSNSGGSSSNSSWIPLNLIHHTWSSAIANEKLSNSNYNYNNINLMNGFNQRHFNCPHRVISDLTAALILPDVERRLKASISATHSTTSTNHKNKRNKSNLPSSTICSSILSSQASSQTTFSAITTGTTKTHQSCCSGKRRRNASESPPLSTYNTTSFNNNNVIKSSLSSSDCWKQSMNNIQVISPNLMKRPYHSKTLISVGNHNDSNNNTSHCLKTTAAVQLDSETLNSKVSNNNNNDKNHNCSTIEQQQTIEQTVGGHYEQNANHNVVKINLTEEQEQEREQQLFVNSTNAITNNNNSTNLFPTKLRMQHESRKRLKKHQKSSTLTCRTLFTPPSYSIDKYIIPRPVLPRRHSMLASSYNLVVSDYGFTHLPH